MTTSLKDIACCFPKARGIIAYGSAAFQQPGLYEGISAGCDAPMLDMIFAADNPLAWHREARITALIYQPCAACIYEEAVAPRAWWPQYALLLPLLCDAEHGKES